MRAHTTFTTAAILLINFLWFGLGDFQLISSCVVCEFRCVATHYLDFSWLTQSPSVQIRSTKTVKFPLIKDIHWKGSEKAMCCCDWENSFPSTVQSFDFAAVISSWSLPTQCFTNRVFWGGHLSGAHIIQITRELQQNRMFSKSVNGCSSERLHFWLSNERLKHQYGWEG